MRLLAVIVTLTVIELVTMIVTELPTTPYLCVAVRKPRMPQKQRCTPFGTTRQSAPFVRNTLAEATPAHDGNVLEAESGQHTFRAKPDMLALFERMHHAGAVTIRARVSNTRSNVRALDYSRLYVQNTACHSCEHLKREEHI